MKVKELIEKLQELNPNLDVYYGVSDTWFWAANEVEVCDPDNFGVDVCLILSLIFLTFFHFSYIFLNFFSLLYETFK